METNSRNIKSNNGKVCLVFNRLDSSSGVARAAVAIAKVLYEHDYDVVLKPLYKCETSFDIDLNTKIKVIPFLGKYIPGLAKFLNLIPARILYRLLVGNEQFDLEIAFQKGQSIRILSASTNISSGHLAWMHGYDSDLLKYGTFYDKVISVSVSNMEKLRKESCNTLNVDVCYNAIDDVAIRALSSQPIQIDISFDRFIFVSVGRISKEKGYCRLPQCVKKLKEQGYVFRIILVGDGPDMEALRNEIIKNQVDDYFLVIGALDNPHTLTAHSDVFLCPSYSEGYSNSCTESIMLGIPVVSTDVSGAREIISSAEAGMVIENSEEGIFNGMRYVLDNPNIVKDWKETILRTRKNFSKEVRTEKLISIIKEYIKNERGRK